MFRKLKTRATAMKTIAALLTQAEEIARSRGAARPAAEHLVIAALQLPDCTAARTFERLGSSAADFSTALAAQEADDLERSGVHADSDRIDSQLPQPSAPGGLYRTEPSAQQLFQAAADDARPGRGALVGAHVLRAAAALEHGPTARAFVEWAFTELNCRLPRVPRFRLEAASRVAARCLSGASNPHALTSSGRST